MTSTQSSTQSIKLLHHRPCRFVKTNHMCTRGTFYLNILKAPRIWRKVSWHSFLTPLFCREKSNSWNLSNGTKQIYFTSFALLTRGNFFSFFIFTLHPIRYYLYWMTFFLQPTKASIILISFSFYIQAPLPTA